jgi:coenzyme F420-0:L-glutamate ligase/coenzyme F420-1:gamma-L-glutamate ligase
LIPIVINEDFIPGDSVAEKLAHAMQHHNLSLQAGDILVVKHKIVSKAEGRIVALRGVKPSRAAGDWAKQSGGDARLIEIALRESRRVIRKKMLGPRGVLITETHHGLVCANSGVDLSNVDGGASAILLPEDPDGSAARIRRGLKKHVGVSVPVIITDTFGRAWREGLTEAAIGVAGIKPLADHRGKRDPRGYLLHATAEAIADELACAAGLVCGKLNRVPACIVRGFKYEPGRGSARELIRPAENDLFR